MLCENQPWDLRKCFSQVLFTHLGVSSVGGSASGLASPGRCVGTGMHLSPLGPRRRAAPPWVASWAEAEAQPCCAFRASVCDACRRPIGQSRCCDWDEGRAERAPLCRWAPGNGVPVQHRWHRGPGPLIPPRLLPDFCQVVFWVPFWRFFGVFAALIFSVVRGKLQLFHCWLSQKLQGVNGITKITSMCRRIGNGRTLETDTLNNFFLLPYLSNIGTK